MAVRERWEIEDEASRNIEWSADEQAAYMKRRREALKGSRAYVQDGSQYHAELLTGPDFGCVLFAAK